MARKQYVYPAPVVQTQADRAEVTLVTIDPVANQVRLTIEKRNGPQVVGSEQLTVPVANLDVFVNNIGSFPGDGFFEKILRFFAAGGIFPPGGSISVP